MKKRNLVFVAFIALITILPIFTSAESITNINGIVISEEEYNNFLKIHTHEYIMTMNEEKYEKLKSLDYGNIITEEKYIATTYNPSLNLITEREMTKSEYENFAADGKSTRLNDGGAEYETTAKILVMSLVGGTTWNYITLSATWKYVPTTRSFDVIGFRGNDLEFMDGTQAGDQIYYLNNVYTVIDYAWNGTNIKRFDNGFGISMNIVNSDIQALQLAVEGDVKATTTTPELFGSYQHAISSVSLADSQNYTLNGVGLGGVFLYPYGIDQKYDGMSGVRISY